LFVFYHNSQIHEKFETFLFAKLNDRKKIKLSGYTYPRNLVPAKFNPFQVLVWINMD